MFTLLKASGNKNVLSQELPGFVIALVIAQLFFKWGSFSLELIGFLITWWLVTFLQERVMSALSRNAE